MRVCERAIAFKATALRNIAPAEYCSHEYCAHGNCSRENFLYCIIEKAYLTHEFFHHEKYLRCPMEQLKRDIKGRHPHIEAFQNLSLSHTHVGKFRPEATTPIPRTVRTPVVVRKPSFQLFQSAIHRTCKIVYIVVSERRFWSVVDHRNSIGCFGIRDANGPVALAPIKNSV